MQRDGERQAPTSKGSEIVTILTAGIRTRLPYLILIGLAAATALMVSGCQQNSGATQPPAAQEQPAPASTGALPPGHVVSGVTENPAPKPTMHKLKSTSVTEKDKDPNGYTSTLKETVWQPIPAGFASPFQHPLDSAVTIDPSSDYDPQTDVVIPYSLTLTNTTKGYNVDSPKISYLLQAVDISGTAINSPRTLESWDWHSDGWSKHTWQVTCTPASFSGAWHVTMDNPDMGAGPNTEWSEPLAPGASDTLNGFFVYHDQFTPAEPKGTRWALDDVRLQATGVGGRIGEITPFLSLSGKVVHENSDGTIRQ